MIAVERANFKDLSKKEFLNFWKVEPGLRGEGPVDCLWVWEARNQWRKKSLEMSR